MTAINLPLYTATFGIAVVAIALLAHIITNRTPAKRSISVGMMGASIFVGAVVWYLVARSDLANVAWL
jgi:apolipoprotein N-acyltransferase